MPADKQTFFDLTDCRGRCLALAASVLALAAKLMAGRDWAAQLQQEYWTLAAVAACRHRNDAAAAASLARLSEHSASLPASSLRLAIAEVDSEHGLEVQGAACSLLVAALAGGPAPGLLAAVPQALKSLRLNAPQQLALVTACACQAPPGGEAREGVVPWLAATAWNAGRRRVEARQLALGGALLRAALALLQAGAAPQDAPLLPRMAAAIADLGPLPELPEPAAADTPMTDAQAGAALLAPAVQHSVPEEPEGPGGSNEAPSPPAPAPVQSKEDACDQPSIAPAPEPPGSAQPQAPPEPAAAAPAAFTFPRLASIAPRESPGLRAKEAPRSGGGGGALAAGGSPPDDVEDEEEGSGWLDAIMAARSLCGDGGAPAPAAAPGPASAQAGGAPAGGRCLPALSLDGASALSLEDSEQG